MVRLLLACNSKLSAAMLAIAVVGSVMMATELSAAAATTQSTGADVDQQQEYRSSKCRHRSSSKCCECTGKVPRNITVYNYLSIQGPNSTAGYNAVQCGAPNRTQPNSFGDTFCFDMPLLAEQDLNSTLLGVVQGTYVYVSLFPPPTSLFVAEAFTLNTSATAQGTFSASGIENIGQVSSKPITGGTADFAFVSGVAVTTPLSTTVDSNGNLGAFFKYVFTFRSAGCKR